MTRYSGSITTLTLVAFLTACVSNEVLESAATSEVQPAQPTEQVAATQNQTIDIATVPLPQTAPEPSTNALAAVEPVPARSVNENAESATNEALQSLQPPVVRGPAKTYLINGLLSAVPFIGYGFRNLKKKMPEAKLYSYMGVVEGPAAIAPAILKDAEAAYRSEPATRINLIGISLGADLITVIAEKLHKKNIPVAYLGIVDGTNLRPINSNVKIADDLTCSYLDCTRAKVRLARGNTTTEMRRKVYRSSHIPLGNHDGMHKRVISASR